MKRTRGALSNALIQRVDVISMCECEVTRQECGRPYTARVWTSVHIDEVFAEGLARAPHFDEAGRPVRRRRETRCEPSGLSDRCWNGWRVS